MAPDDAWAIGEFTNADNIARTLAEHWDGRAWTVVSSPSPGSDRNALQALAAVSSADVWAVGYWTNTGGASQTLAEHWNGSAWAVVPSPDLGTAGNEFEDVAAVAADDVWAVGATVAHGFDAPLIAHWTGAAWQVVPSPPVGTDGSALEAVAARASDDVWAVGFSANGSSTYQTLTEHWDGSAWTVVPSPSAGTRDNVLTGVAALAPDDVWAVGSYPAANGAALTLTEHWDGSAWTIVPSPNVGSTGSTLARVAALAPGDVWAVGYYQTPGDAYQPLAEHWDGSAWSVVAGPDGGPVGASLLGVAPADTGTVWAVGLARDSGAVGHTLVARSAPCGAIPSPTPIAFSDVHSSDYFYQAVQYLAAHAIISGYADGTFRPYANTTRAQMVKIVILGFGRPIVTPAPGAYTFADVPPGAPFFDVIETAASGQIVSGYGCGGPGEPCDAQNRPYFRPNADVTRGQLSKIDVIAAGWGLRPPPPPGTFADVVPGSAFYDYVETAACQGVISGYACGGPGEPCNSANRPYFRPGHPAIRGQIAKIVYLSLTATGGCAAPGR